MSSDEDGISELEIEKVIKNSDNEHFKRNFVDVYPWNHINKFVDFHKLMEKCTICLFDLIYIRQARNTLG